MNRRDALLKLSGLTGFPLVLVGCSMDAVRRAEANLGWRMRQPGTGVQFSGLPEVVKVIILATYPATPQQTQVAEQRARTAVATIAHRARKTAPSQKPRAHDVAAHQPKAKPASRADEPSKPASKADAPKHAAVHVDEPAAKPVSEPKAAAALLKEEAGTTVVAVDTTPDSRLQGTRAVMLWNTQTQSFVGNNVYDISSPPAKGQVAQWGSTTARYVGTGTGSL